MNTPNVFGQLADCLEHLKVETISPVLLLGCGAGFWFYTGSVWAALALTLLAIVPLAMMTGVLLAGTWLGLRVLDAARRLFSGFAGH